MREIKQTKLYDPKGAKRGNCFATVIACILECDLEDVPNVETLFDLGGTLWCDVINEWLNSKGWEWHTIQPGHIFNNELYLVTGKSPRGVMHVCIYQNGKMIWDPHPSGTGLLTEEHWEALVRVS